MASRNPGEGGSEEPPDESRDDDFDQIVAGLELSMPADLDDFVSGTPADPEPDPEVFNPQMSDPLDEDDFDDEHFIPPEPDPFPELDPLTRTAWGVLIGSPILLLVMTVFALSWPQWLPSGLILAFVAALVFLLTRRGNHDRGSDPDQGAVI